jgi:hypothetical protein
MVCGRRMENTTIIGQEREMNPQELYDKGYRIVSRKYRIVSRVDISDEEMIVMFIKENFGDKYSGIPCSSIEQQKDYYRRCISKDTLKIHNNVLKKLLQITRNQENGLSFI